MKTNSKSKGPGSFYCSPVDRAHAMIDYRVGKFELAMRMIAGLPLPKRDVNSILKNKVLISRQTSA